MEISEAKTFRGELQSLINRYSMENESNTPDFILAQYLESCLFIFDRAVNQRENWYGRLGTEKKSHILQAEAI